MPLIIDGNNAIGHWGIEESAFIRLLGTYCQAHHRHIELFFDGERDSPVMNPATGLLKIRYSGHGYSADDAILQFISMIQDKSNWQLVTDDRELQREASWQHLPHMKVEALKKTMMVQMAKDKAVETAGPDKPGYEADEDGMAAAMLRGKKT